MPIAGTFSPLTGIARLIMALSAACGSIFAASAACQGSIASPAPATPVPSTRRRVNGLSSIESDRFMSDVLSGWAL